MAQVTRFSAFPNNSTINGVNLLPASLTINSLSENPQCRYKLGDADATDLAPWGYGDTLLITGTGAPTFNNGSPLLGAQDDSCLFNAGQSYKFSTTGGAGDITTEDFVFEMVVRTAPAGQSWSCVASTYGNTPGYRLLVDDGRCLFQLFFDTGTVNAFSTDDLESDTWYHIMFFANKSEASTNATRFYVNGVDNGGGYDLGTTHSSGTLAGAQEFEIGGDHAPAQFPANIPIAYFAMWMRSAWHQEGAAGPTEWAGIAADRFARLIGTYPKTAQGTALPLVATRNSHAHIEKLNSGVIELYRVGRHWIRCVSRPNTALGDSWTAGVLIERADSNLVPNSNAFSEWFIPAGANIAVTDNFAEGPDKRTSAAKIVANSTSGSHVIQSLYFRQSATDTRNINNESYYCYSVWAKAGDKNFIRINGPGTGSWVYFDLGTGSIGTWSVGSLPSLVVGMRDYGNGWYRCIVGGIEVVEALQTRMIIYVADSDSSVGPWAGDGSTISVYLYGAQVEQAPMHSTYFDTGNGASDEGGVDREPDVLIYKGDDGNIDGVDGTAGEGVISADVHWVYTKGTEPSGTAAGRDAAYDVGYKKWRFGRKTIAHLQSADASSEILLAGDGQNPVTEYMNMTARVEKSGGNIGLSFASHGQTDTEGDKNIKATWDTDVTTMTFDGANATTDTDVTKQTDAITHIGIGVQPSTSGLQLGTESISDFLITSAAAVNDITITGLDTNTVTPTSFNADLIYSGDDNENATLALWYCNETDSPGCDPLTGSSVSMVRDSPSAGKFRGIVSSLAAPNDPGDTLNLKAVATDADGTTNSPLTDTVRLPIWAITVSGISTDNVTSNSFDVENFYADDENNNAILTLYYCNETDSPGCDPTGGTAVVMNRDQPTSGKYSVGVSGLSYPNSPGDTLNLRIVAVDVDGVTGSPLDTTVVLAARDDLEISNLQVSGLEATGFDVGIDYLYDQNNNSSAVLYYCNDTDSPGCDPLLGSSQAMTKAPIAGTDGGEFVTSVEGLSAPNDPGDTLNILVSGVDPDGVTGSPVSGQVTLSADAIIVNSCTIDTITDEGFDVTIDYSGDNDGDASALLWYCNRTTNPTCDPVTDGSSTAMVNNTSLNTFTKTLTGLSKNDPGDTYATTVVVTDPDGVFGSPISCANTTLLAGANLTYIPGNNTISTAKDAPTISGINMGAFFCGQTRLESFQLGNTSSTLTIRATVSATGLNGEIVDDVNFSLDRETWTTSLVLEAIEPNEVSPTIWVRYVPEAGSIVGAGTFKIQVVTS